MDVSQPNGQKLKIMIINDEEDILTLYSDYLSNKGYQVIAKYTDASDIKDDVRMNTPDVFIIDYRLPGAKYIVLTHSVQSIIRSPLAG